MRETAEWSKALWNDTPHQDQQLDAISDFFIVCSKQMCFYNKFEADAKLGKHKPKLKSSTFAKQFALHAQLEIPSPVLLSLLLRMLTQRERRKPIAACACASIDK